MKHLVFSCIIVLVCIILYAEIPDYRFTGMDDTRLITSRMAFLEKAENLPWFFNMRYAFDDNTFYYYHYRPLLELSFRLDAVMGKGDYRVFYLTNILLHILMCILAYFLFLCFSLTPKSAFSFSLIYAVHPFMVHAVAWIPGRNDTLFGIWALLSCLFFIRWIQKEKNLFLILHTIALFMALFTKETAIVLPFVLFPFLFKKTSPIQMPVPQPRGKWIASVWCGFFVLFLGIRFFLHAPGRAGEDNALKMLAELVYPFFHYLARFFYPQGFSAFPEASFQAGIAGAAIALGVPILIRLSAFASQRIMVFGLMWFGLFLFPPAVHEALRTGPGVYLEHRAAVPLFGLLLACGVPADALMKSRPKLSCLVMAVFFSLVSGFFLVSFNRIPVYKNPDTYSENAVLFSPASSKAHFLRAMVFLEKGKPGPAQFHIRMALFLDPDNLRAKCAKARILVRLNEPEKALMLFSQVLEKNPEYLPALFERAGIFFRKKNYDKALEDLRLLLKLQPGFLEAENMYRMVVKKKYAEKYSKDAKQP